MSSNPSPRVFLTGATGFVGGSVLTSLYKAHPTIHVKALIRQEAVGEELSRVYPNFTPVIGTLSSHSLLTSTAADVDFVIHVSGDNVPAVCAMIDGLASSSAAGPGSSRPRLISMTGTRSLIDLSLPITGVASPDSRPWSDIVDARAILSLPKEAIPRGGGSSDHRVRRCKRCGYHAHLAGSAVGPRERALEEGESCRDLLCGGQKTRASVCRWRWLSDVVVVFDW